MSYGNFITYNTTATHIMISMVWPAYDRSGQYLTYNDGTAGWPLCYLHAVVCVYIHIYIYRCMYSIISGSKTQQTQNQTQTFSVRKLDETAKV